MNRREFIGWVGVGGIATYLPVAIAACSTNTTETTQKTEKSTVRSDGFESVGTVMELSQDSVILNKKTTIGAVLVVRNPDNSEQLMAVNPKCTHAGCIVDWKADQRILVCPCHASNFAMDGKVLKGPATKPLATYEAKIEGNSVLVKVK